MSDIVHTPETNEGLLGIGLMLPSVFEQALKQAKAIVDSGMVPKGYARKHCTDNGINAEAQVVIALQYGAQIGLVGLVALQSIVVVNGTPTIMGDAAKALIRSSSVCEYWKESYEGGEPKLDNGDWNPEFKHVIKTKRVGSDEVVKTFSIGDAIAAGLINKDMYKKWPKRMIMYRNTGFTARDEYSDVMKGLKTKEEVEDYPEQTTVLTNAAGQVVEMTSNMDKVPGTSDAAVAMVDDMQISPEPEEQVFVEDSVEEAEVVEEVVVPEDGYKLESWPTDWQIYTETLTKNMKVPRLIEIINERGIGNLLPARMGEVEGGVKYTNKLLRTILFNQQDHYAAPKKAHVPNEPEKSQKQVAWETDIKDLCGRWTDAEDFDQVKELHQLLDPPKNDLMIIASIGQVNLKFEGFEDLARSATKRELVTFITEYSKRIASTGDYPAAG